MSASYAQVFFHGCFDDPAKLLALSTATALAAPFEDYFMDGKPLVEGALTTQAGELRAWSGVRLGADAHWLVLTPGDQQGHTLPSTLTLTIALPSPGLDGSSGIIMDRVSGVRTASALSGCDLTTGRALHADQLRQTAMNVTISDLALDRTTVLHVAPGAAAKCEPLPSDVWLPVPGYNNQPA
jgi:hypothetical protein